MKRGLGRIGITLAGLLWYSTWVYIAEVYILRVGETKYADVRMYGHFLSFTAVGGGIAWLSAAILSGIIVLVEWIAEGFQDK